MSLAVLRAFVLRLLLLTTSNSAPLPHNHGRLSERQRRREKKGIRNVAEVGGWKLLLSDCETEEVPLQRFPPVLLLVLDGGSPKVPPKSASPRLFTARSGSALFSSILSHADRARTRAHDRVSGAARAPRLSRRLATLYRCLLGK